MDHRYQLGLSLWLISASLGALPSGMQGEATVSVQETAMHISTTKSGILQWDAFSLAPNEHVHFAQARSSDLVVNRVMGQARSDIFGSLTSNGQLYLINPNGILFGPDASVISAGFLASTLDAANEALLQGGDVWFQGEGTIVNLGTITAPQGSITLLARHIENHGILTATHGSVSLGAATEILLKPEGSHHIFIGLGEEGSLLQAGTLEGLSVELQASGNPYTYAIRHTGTTKTLEEENGRILLKAKTGKIDVSGNLEAPANEIDIFAPEIAIHEAVLTISGKADAGSLRVGGDFQGQTEGEENSTQVTVSEDTLIDASGGEVGSGGRVIFWSDRRMVHQGQILAQGGSKGGDGGFIEVSGKETLDIFGLRANTLAPCGKTGTLFLDPTDITISTAADSGGSLSACPGSTFTASGASAVINTTTLQGLLATCNVSISTASAFGGTGIVQINNDVTWAASTTWTITAQNGITIATGVTLSNTEGVSTFTAFDFTATGGGVSVGGTGSGTTSITTQAGGITLIGTHTAGFGVTVGVDSSSASGVIETTSGPISITGTSTSGAVSFRAGVSLIRGSITSTSGDITINGTGGANYGFARAPGAGNITTGGSGIIQISGSTTNASRSSVYTRGGSIASEDGNIIISGTGSGPVTLAQQQISTTGTGSISVTSAVGINTLAAEAIGGTSLQTGSSGTITLQGTSIDWRRPNGLDTHNSITSGGGDISLNATSGNLLLGGTFTQTGTGDIDFTASSTIFFSDISSFTQTSSIQMNGNGTVNFNSPLRVQRSTSISGFFGASVNFLSTLDGGSDFSVSMNGGGVIDCQGVAGGIASFSSLNLTTFGGTLNLYGNVTGNTLQLEGLNIFLHNPIQINVTGGILDSFGTIDGSGNNLTINATGGGSANLDTITNVPTLFNIGNSLTVNGSSTIPTVDLSSMTSGTMAFNGSISIGTALITAATNYSIQFNGGGTITNNTTFLNTGAVRFGGGTTNFPAGISIAAPTTTQLVSGTVTTSNTAMTMAGVSLSGSNALTTGGGNLTLGDTLGSGSLSINAGTGSASIGFLSAGTFTVTNTGTLNISQTATVTTVNLSGKSAGSNVTFGGAANIGTLTTAATAYGIVFSAGGTITNSTTFLNTGGVTFGGGTLTFTGGVNTSAGNTTATGTVNTTGTAMTMGAVSLTGTTSFNTSNGTMTLGAVSNAQNFSINPGNGSATIASLNINNFTVTNGGTVSITGATTAATVNLASKAAGSNVVFNGAASITTLTTGATAYGVVFNNGGTVTNSTTFLNTGGVTFAGSAFNFPGGVNTASGLTTLGVTVNTTNNPLTMGSVTLTGTSALNTSNGALSLGDVTGAHALTINPGTNTATITSLNITGFTVQNGGAINVTSPSTVTNVDLSAKSAGSDVTFGGDVTFNTLTTGAAAYGIDLQAGGTVSTSTTFLNTGGVTFGGVTPMNFPAGVNSSAGMTTAQGTVTTTNNPMIMGPLTLTSSTILTTDGGDLTLGDVTGAQTLSINPGAGVTTIDSLDISVFAVTNSAALTITGATVVPDVNLNAKSAGSDVTFGGAVTITTLSTAGSAYGVAFNSGGTITDSTTFLNTSGVTFGGGTMNFTGGVDTTAGNTTATGTITTTANPMTMGSLNLTGATVLTTAGGLLTLGDVTGGVDLSVDSGAGATNIASLNAAVFAVPNAASLSIAGATTATTVNLGVISIGSNATFGGAVTLGTLTTTASPYGVEFLGGGTVTNSTTFLNTGGVTFGGGTITFAGGVNTTAGNTTATGTINTTGTGMTLGAVSLSGTTTLASAGGLITLAGTVNGNQTLNVNSSSGNTVIQGEIGGSTPLSVLNITANQTTIGADITAQGGTIIIDSPVVLSGDTTFTDTGGTGISFLSSITGPYNLTILATQGDVSVDGAINTSGSTGGDVDITATLGSITVNGITTSGTAGDAGNITLQPNPNFTVDGLGAGTLIPDGLLRLYGPLTALSTGGTAGTISLSATGRTEGMSVATIHGNPSDSDLIIQGGTLTIGPFEALTVFGNVTFDLSTLAQVGDIVSVEAIAITAPTINTLLHEPFQILDNLGALYENDNLHFLALDSVTLTGTQVPIGTGLDPDIAIVPGLTRSEFVSRLSFSGYVLNYDEPTIPPPPPVIPTGLLTPAQEYKIYRFNVANTQLLEYFPMAPYRMARPARFYQELSTHLTQK